MYFLPNVQHIALTGLEWTLRGDGVVPYTFICGHIRLQFLHLAWSDMPLMLMHPYGRCLFPGWYMCCLLRKWPGFSSSLSDTSSSSSNSSASDILSSETCSFETSPSFTSSSEFLPWFKLIRMLERKFLPVLNWFLKSESVPLIGLLSNLFSLLKLNVSPWVWRQIEILSLVQFWVSAASWDKTVCRETGPCWLGSKMQGSILS